MAGKGKQGKDKKMKNKQIKPPLPYKVRTWVDILDNQMPELLAVLFTPQHQRDLPVYNILYRCIKRDSPCPVEKIKSVELLLKFSSDNSYNNKL